MNGFAFRGRLPIYPGCRKSAFDPCIPTRSTTVPAGKDWIHEIKHDGYRLIVQRDGQRVRLFTRNGHDWSGRYPLITEAALRNRNSSFVIDGEAVLLGVDGVSDFNGLHTRNFDAFDVLGATARISANFHCIWSRNTPVFGLTSGSQALKTCHDAVRYPINQ